MFTIQQIKLKLEVIGMNAYKYNSLEEFVRTNYRDYHAISRVGIRKDDLMCFVLKKA